MNTKYTNRIFSILAAMAMVDAAGSSVGVVDRPMRPIESQEPKKFCMLPGCKNERHWNYLYCCAAHCKQHQQMKKEERKSKRKN